MRLLIVAVVTVFTITPSFALTISWEIERGFRFFKYNSDFELHRLAFKDYQERHANEKPTPRQLDTLLSDPHWWSHALGPRTAAWYGHAANVAPLNLLLQWRKREISEGRYPGYLELADRLEALKMQGWEYHPARMGWASLLFPAHQKPEDFGKSDLVSSSNVAVCWNRAAQRHSNCGGLDAYINPRGHNIIVRALSAPDTRILDGQCKWTIAGDAAADFVLPTGIAEKTLEVSCSADVRIFVPAGKEIAVKLQRDAIDAEISASIQDELVVGVGDSFSSGEGNPDVPAKLQWSADPQVDWAANGDRISDDVTHGPIRKAVGDYWAAQWIDRSCHRSAYSYQLRSALHLALDDTTRAITFLSYSCSGAEVNEGLFQPYHGPEYTESKANLQAFERAQFPLLLKELCIEYRGGRVREKLTVDQEMDAIGKNEYRLGGVISDVAYRCANQPAGEGFKRPIDLLYLSVGGNDLGFSRWILATITSETFPSAFLPILEPDNAAECAQHKLSCRETRGRWTRFNARYVLLRDFIDHRLSFRNRGQAPVLLLTYPQPVRDQNGELCPNGNASSTVFVRSGILKMCVKRIQNNLPVLETISNFTEERLNGTIDNLVADKDADGKPRPSWIAIKDHKAAFMKRGFCASKAQEMAEKPIPAEPFVGCKSGNQVEAMVRSIGPITGPAVQETLHFPIGEGSATGNFLPFEPVFDYQPYHHRTRLVRTMNEVQFVINQLTANTQAAKAAGILSLRNSAVFGAFHPTGEAHAIFADGFFAESKTILEKPLQ